MSGLPKIITPLLLILFSSLPVQAETTIDISPVPEYGDTIPIDTPLNRQGKIEGEIGPKPNQIKFPDLSKENGFYSGEEGFLNALPQETQQKLKFNDPTQQEIKDKFGGKIAHPLCDKAKIIKTGEETEERETADPIIQSNPVGFTPPTDFFQIILRTGFWQSILVPQKGSDLEFGIDVSQRNPDNQAGCNPDKQGKGAEAVTVQNDPPAPLNFLGSLFGNVFDFLKDFFAGTFEGGVRVVARVEQTKYLPGETVLADQTVGGNGFLNFFKPEGAEFTNQGDQEEQVAYRVLKEDRSDIGITYKGVSSLKGGTLDLVKSLYPEGMAPTSLAAVTTSAPGSVPSGFLGGIPKPNRALGGVIGDAAAAFGVPTPVLTTIAWVEGRAMWDLTESEIEQYSAPGAISPINPTPNGCRAVGPMQFLIGGIATSCPPKLTGTEMPNVWGDYASAINEATGENRTPNPRNIKDAIYATAKKLKRHSQTATGYITWNEADVKRAVSGWYGQCEPDDNTQAVFGPGKGYCDYVWGIVVQSRQPF